MRTPTRRKYRYDPECFWIVVELADETGEHRSPEPVKLYCFEDREPAQEFLEEPDKPRRHGPYPLLRAPAERAIPLLVAAAEAVLAAPGDTGLLPFLEKTWRLARFDPSLPDVYRDVRRVLLYEDGRPPGDPRYVLEQGLKPYLERKTSLRKGD